MAAGQDDFFSQIGDLLKTDRDISYLELGSYFNPWSYGSLYCRCLGRSYKYNHKLDFDSDPSCWRDNHDYAADRFYNMKKIQVMEICCEQGSDYAQFILGCCYLKGYEVEMDKEKGLTLLFQSAEKGNTDSLRVLENPACWI